SARRRLPASARRTPGRGPPRQNTPSAAAWRRPPRRRHRRETARCRRRFPRVSPPARRRSRPRVRAARNARTRAPRRAGTIPGPRRTSRRKTPAARGRHPPRVEIEIPQLAPIPLIALVDLAAVNLADIHAEGNKAQPHPIVALERIRRLHRQIGERTRIGEVKLDLELGGHQSYFFASASAAGTPINSVSSSNVRPSAGTLTWPVSLSSRSVSRKFT